MIRPYGWLILAPWLVTSAIGQEPRSETPLARSDVIDSAKLFPSDAVTHAKARLAAMEKVTKVPVTIETVESLHGESVDEAALKAARLSGGDGLFIFIAKDERKIAKPLVRRQFEHRLSEERRSEIRQAILEGFKAGDFGEGLKRGIDAIGVALNLSQAPAPAATDPAWGLASHPTPSVVRNQVRLTLAGARKALTAAEAKAIEMGVKANLAVVDDGGHLLAFVRMDGARPASVATAQTKAVSAATFRQETGPNAKSGDPNLNLGLALAGAAGGARITPLLGGIPIIVDGQVVGALGAAGGSGEQDAGIARAGVAALSEDIKTQAEKETPKP